MAATSQNSSAKYVCWRPNSVPLYRANVHSTALAQPITKVFLLVLWVIGSNLGRYTGQPEYCFTRFISAVPAKRLDMCLE